MSAIWIILFMMASAAYSGLETGGYLLNRIRLRYRTRHGDLAAKRLSRVLSDSYLFIFTVLIGNNIAVYLVSRSVTNLYLQNGFSGSGQTLLGFIPWTAETAATLTLTLPLFIFAEMWPKNLFRRNPDVLMYRLSGWLYLSWGLLRPITSGLKLFFHLLTGGRSSGEALSNVSLSLQGLREYFLDDSFQESLSEHQHGMIDNLVSMHRVPVNDLMRPVKSIASVSETLTVQEALDVMKTQNVEQLAVYRGSARRLTGYITLFDLMNPDLKPSESIKLHLKKLVRLHSGWSLSRAFRRLQKAGSAPAIVTDRTSLAIGMLSLRDIARHIVSSS